MEQTAHDLLHDFLRPTSWFDSVHCHHHPTHAAAVTSTDLCAFQHNYKKITKWHKLYHTFHNRKSNYASSKDKLYTHPVCSDWWIGLSSTIKYAHLSTSDTQFYPPDGDKSTLILTFHAWINPLTVNYFEGKLTMSNTIFGLLLSLLLHFLNQM